MHMPGNVRITIYDAILPDQCNFVTNGNKILKRQNMLPSGSGMSRKLHKLSDISSFH